MAAQRGEYGRAVRGGVIAGLIGGAVLEMLALIPTAAAGRDIWQPLKGAATPLIGEAAMQPGFAFWPVALGLVCHFAVAVGWAVPFALLVYGNKRLATVGYGVLLGVVVWLGMYYVVLPLVGLGAVARVVPVFVAVVSHVLFGVAVALAFLPFQHARPTRAVVTRAEPTYKPTDRRPPEARP